MAEAKQQSSKIFIELSDETKKQKVTFNYPLKCTFERRVFNETSRSFNVVDDLSVNVQEGGLAGGLNLHLKEVAEAEIPYRLNVKIVDNHGIQLVATHWLLLTKKGTVDDNNSEKFNTLHVEVVPIIKT